MANNTIYVTGHKNPDTDSIVCAMAYAYLKQQLGFDAIAVRIGHLNQETQYILSLFNEFAPPYIRDIRTRVRDIDIDEVVTCPQSANMAQALRLMKEADKKVIAITDEENELVGMATISDIMKPLIEQSSAILKIVRSVSVEEMADFMKARLLVRSQKQNNDGTITVAMSLRSIRDGCRNHIVICSADEQLQKAAIEAGASTLIIAEGAAASPAVLQLAESHDCSVIATEESGFRSAQEIYFAASIRQVMSSKLTLFRCDDYIDDVKQVINKSRFRSYPVLDSRNRIVGTISRYHVLKHTNRNLILVDHNEMAQSVDGAEDANILEIIDHHRLGGIKTTSPINIRFEQVGCCATIITQLFKERNVEIPEDLAGLLCCAIISDTVNFHSVTCTQKDIDTAAYLAALGKIDIKELAPKILAAGASLSNRSADAIFHNDMKVFRIGRTKVAVGQSNVVDFKSVVAIRQEMSELLKNYARDSGCGIVMMAFTLIDGSGSYVLSEGREVRRIAKVMEKNGRESDGYVFLPHVISRKQQLIPMITETLEEA
ncbi:MAG: putative manganese-dependent inorganic diphosphatase [Erysipelotrichaceae bacterium]|nr:putative manganese-dependent inorganic diphosphatase [Erysipelotrichaceae bacterium]